MVEGIRAYNSRLSDELPKEGDLVSLRFVDSSVDSFTARVDDKLTGDYPEIVLTYFDELLDQGGKESYFLESGQKLVMEWPSEDGYHSMPIELTSKEFGQDATFLVTPSSTGEVFERRRYFRVSSLSKAVIWGHAKAGVDTTVIDLSEGGMRCIVDANTWPESRKTVDVRLKVGDVTVDIAGRVVRHTEKDGMVKLGIEFLVTDDKNAAIIRRHLYDLQRSAARGSISK